MQKHSVLPYHSKKDVKLFKNNGNSEPLQSRKLKNWKQSVFFVFFLRVAIIHLNKM